MKNLGSTRRLGQAKPPKEKSYLDGYIAVMKLLKSPDKKKTLGESQKLEDKSFPKRKKEMPGVERNVPDFITNRGIPKDKKSLDNGDLKTDLPTVRLKPVEDRPKRKPPSFMTKVKRKLREVEQMLYEDEVNNP